MKIYESKTDQILGQYFWCFCFYVLIVVICVIISVITNTAMTFYTFGVIALMWLVQSWRIHRLHYRIKDNALIQFDFQTKTIHIEQIKSIYVLSDMKWISFHIPYNMMIVTENNEKHRMAPKKAELLAKILVQKNPKIQIIKETV